MFGRETAVTLVGLAAAACTTGAFAPQAVRVWRLKSAREISLTTFVAFTVGTVAWLGYGLLIGSIPVIAANSATFVLALAIVALTVKYRAARRPGPARPVD